MFFRTRKMVLKAPRRSSGQHIIELMAGLMALIPVIMVLIDIAIILTAVNINDSVCRDAARAAAQGDPEPTGGDPGPIARAQAVVDQRQSQIGGYITKIELLPAPDSKVVVVTSPDPTYGGSYTGNVTVVTKIHVKVPASLPGLVPDHVDLSSRQTFPITFQRPNTYKPT